jgi:nucleoside-diphosphate-sugar epimerase
MTKRICVTGASGRAGRVTQNMTMNFNVFTAAAQAKLERVVWVSSEITLGLPFDEPARARLVTSLPPRTP